MQFIALSLLFGLGALPFFFLGTRRRKSIVPEGPERDRYVRSLKNPARKAATVITLVLIGPAAAAMFEAISGAGAIWWVVLGAIILVILAVQVVGRTVASKQAAGAG